VFVCMCVCVCVYVCVCVFVHVHAHTYTHTHMAEAEGSSREAMNHYSKALSIDPHHASSLLAKAGLLVREEPSLPGGGGGRGAGTSTCTKLRGGGGGGGVRVDVSGSGRAAATKAINLVYRARARLDPDAWPSACIVIAGCCAALRRSLSLWLCL
jgi:hypothetical protein